MKRREALKVGRIRPERARTADKVARSTPASGRRRAPARAPASEAVTRRLPAVRKGSRSAHQPASRPPATPRPARRNRSRCQPLNYRHRVPAKARECFVEACPVWRSRRRTALPPSIQDSICSRPNISSCAAETGKGVERFETPNLKLSRRRPRTYGRTQRFARRRCSGMSKMETTTCV